MQLEDLEKESNSITKATMQFWMHVVQNDQLQQLNAQLNEAEAQLQEMQGSLQMMAPIVQVTKEK